MKDQPYGISIKLRLLAKFGWDPSRSEVVSIYKCP